MPLADDETITSIEYEREYESKEEEQIEMERRIWTNEEKANGTYSHKLPDGFQSYVNSCNQTMNLTFRKGNTKEDDRWIINETGNEYTSLNQARADFFGDELKSKQSVWLHTRSTKDGRSLREVIEGN